MSTTATRTPQLRSSIVVAPYAFASRLSFLILERARMTAVARRLRRLIEKLACRARLAHDGCRLRRVLIISPRDARRALALGHARLILELAGSARNTPAATDAWHVR